MPRYFPSKKVFVVGVLAIVLLAWSIVHTKASQQNSAISENILRTVASAEASFPDSDGDGLYDWEEALYGTDQNNKDSDGNGVLDGLQYSPKGKDFGPRLSDSLYAAINRMGESLESIPDPVELLSQEPVVYEPPFTKKDVLYMEDTRETRNLYISVAFLVLSEHADVLENDPLKLVEEWLQTSDSSKLDTIGEYSTKTKKIALELLKINVPQHYIDMHLDMANNLFLSAISLDDISVTPYDPMGGFFAAANYVNYQSKYMDAVLELTTLYEYVEENEVKEIEDNHE